MYSSYHNASLALSSEGECSHSLANWSLVMKTTIALFGAGGKMGVRLAKNLQGSDYRVRHVEVGAVGRQRPKAELGVECVSVDAPLDGAGAVTLPVPDHLLGKVA